MSPDPERCAEAREWLAEAALVAEDVLNALVQRLPPEVKPESTKRT